MFGIGKMIHVESTEDKVMDADYFQKVLEDRSKGLVTIPIPTDVLKNMIVYMRGHNLKLAPGHYRFHQGWSFKDGKFIQKGLLWNNEYEVFKFQTK